MEKLCGVCICPIPWYECIKMSTDNVPQADIYIYTVEQCEVLFVVIAVAVMCLLFQ